jgi:hypothetical protein
MTNLVKWATGQGELVTGAKNVSDNVHTDKGQEMKRFKSTLATESTMEWECT